MLIDSHAHIHFKDFEGEIDAVLERAREAGVSSIINVGTDLKSSHEAVKIAESYPDIYAAVGIHPHDAAKATVEDLQDLRELSKNKKVVAIGEVGLDYYYKHSPQETQRERLRDQVRLAMEVKLPLIIHCRDAFEDCFRILDEEGGWKGGGVFHCYTGDQPTAERIIAKGFYISFSGIITFKKSEALRMVAKAISGDHILVETDCPFLAPEPYRGKRNEPAYVREVARRVAEVRGVPLDDISQATTMNTSKLFRLNRSGAIQSS